MNLGLAQKDCTFYTYKPTIPTHFSTLTSIIYKKIQYNFATPPFQAETLILKGKGHMVPKLKNFHHLHHHHKPCYAA